MQSKNRKDLALIKFSVFSSAVALHQIATMSAASANGLHGFKPHNQRNGNDTIRTNERTAANNFASHFGLNRTALSVSKQQFMNQHRRNFDVQSLVQRTTQLQQNIVNSAPALQLDLGSTNDSIELVADFVRHGSSVTIDVAGSERTFNVGDKVTPAELIAIQQAQFGKQTLQLNSGGSASGGTFSLDRLMSSKSSFNVAHITIPQNVQAIDRVNSRNEIEISGALINYGTISERGKQNGIASLSAQNIFNHSTGLITTKGGLSSIDLTLNAAEDFTNEGTIISSGSLAINSGNVINSGTLQSENGNITFDTPVVQTLSVNNTNGVISALSGAINVREATYKGSASANLFGGNLLSRNLNLNSGGGTIDVNVNELTGMVTSTGTAVHVTGNTDNLNLGSQCLTGDPTFYNPGGDITINGDLTVSEALAIIASGNIKAAAAASLTLASNGSGQGFDISLIAGADVTAAGGNTTTTVPGTNAISTTSFTGASPTGGDVDLSAASAFAINSNSTAGNQNGGNITIAAYSGSGGGNIIAPLAILNASGFGSGTHGDVTLVAPNLVQIGSIANGAANGANNVSITTSQPIFSTGSSISFDPLGNISSGNKIIGDVANLTTGPLNVQSSILASGNVRMSSGSDAIFVTTKIGGSLTVTAKNDLTIGGILTAPQGMLLLAGHNIFSTAAATTISTEGATQVGNKAGAITAIAGADFTQTVSLITINQGPGTGGGTLTGGDLNVDNTTLISANATVANSDGGNVTLVAFTGTDNKGGITYRNSQIRSQANNISKTSGDITLVAGGVFGIDIQSNTLNTTGGKNNSGNIFLNAATPNVAAGPITILTNGSIQSGAFENGAPAPGSVNYSGAISCFTNGSFIKLIGGGSVATSQSFFASNTDLILQAPFVTFGGGNNLRSVNIMASNDISIVFQFAVNKSFSAVAGGNIDCLPFAPGAMQAPGGITLIAGGNITTGVAGNSITTSSASGDAGNITIVAGAAFTESAGVVTVTGASATGGKIDFGTKAITSMSAKSTGGGGDGGLVTLVAFADKATGKSLGQIDLGGATVFTGGNGAGANGDVVLVAGNNNGLDALGTPANKININTTGGALGTGNITLSSSTPNTSPPVDIEESTGKLLVGNFLNGILTNGTQNIGTLTSTGFVLAEQKGTFNLSSPLTSGNFVVRATDINVTGNITANAVSLLAEHDITVGGNLIAPGGLLLISSHDIVTTSAGVSFDTSSGTGDSGNMSMVAGAAYTIGSGDVSIAGGSKTGGKIDFQTFAIATMNTKSTASGGNGGSINLAAFTGSDDSGTVYIDSGATLFTGSGGGLAANGQVQIVAGRATPTTSAIQVGTVNTQGLAGSFAGTGPITLVASTPNASVIDPIILAAGTNAGTPIGGLFLGGAVQQADIIAGDLLAPAANVTVVTGRNAKVGNINVAGGIGSVSGGAANITTKGTVAFDIGTATANSALSIDISGGTTDGAAGSLNIVSPTGITWSKPGAIVQNVVDGQGAQITFDAANGQISLPVSTLSVDAVGGNSAGGSITMTASSYVWANMGTAPLTLSANGSGLFFAGTIDFINTDKTAQAIGNKAGNFKLSATGGGGFVSFGAPNAALTVDSSAIIITPVTNAPGSNLALTGSTIVNVDNTKVLVLDASGNGTGSGGSVSVATTSNVGTLFIGAGAGSIQLISQSGANGGNVAASAGGNLTVDPNGIINGPLGANGDGGSIFLQGGATGTGNLTVLGPLSVAGKGTGVGGQLTLQSNSAIAFIIGGKKITNGISGAPVLSGSTNGSLFVTNFGGGITQSADLLQIASATYSAGGVGSITLSKVLGDANTSSITLTTTGTGNITDKKGIQADNISLTSAGGDIGGKKAFTITAVDSLDANANKVVNVLNKATTPIILNASSSTTSTVKFTSAGNLTVAQPISAPTSVTIATSNKTGGSIILNQAITSGGTINILGTGTGDITIAKGVFELQAPNITLETGSGAIGSPLSRIRFQADNISATADKEVFLDNKGINGLHLIDGDTKGTFSLRSNSNLFIDTSLKSASDIFLFTNANNANVSVNASQGGKSTSTILLNSNGSGDIEQLSSKIKLTASNSVNLGSTTGDIGSAGVRMNVVSPTLAFFTGGTGGVFVQDSAKGKVVLDNSSAGSGGMDVRVGSGGLEIFDTLTADSVVITATGGLMQLDPGIPINALTSIVLNNTSTKGSILFGAGSTVTTNAKVPGSGQIQIVVGSMPPPLVQGTKPANVIDTETGVGKIFWNAGITANAPNNIVKAIDTNLVFSAPTAGQIVLDGGVTIIADPPPPLVLMSSPVENSSGSLQPVSLFHGVTLGSPSVETSIGLNGRAQKLPEFIPNMGNLFDRTSMTILSTQSADVSFAQPEIDMPINTVRASEGAWISDTELANGQIPAMLIGELAFDTDQQVSSNESETKLDVGSIMTASTKDRTIETKFGNVSIAANSLVVAMSFKNGIAIYNLHDTKKSAVRFTAGAQELSVSPGHCIVISKDSARTFDDVNPAQLVAYRHIGERKIGNGLKAYNAEFSIPTAINAMPSVKKLMTSKHPHAVRMSKQFLKTTSILLQLQSGGANFQQRMRPQVTACK